VQTSWRGQNFVVPCLYFWALLISARVPPKTDSPAGCSESNKLLYVNKKHNLSHARSIIMKLNDMIGPSPPLGHPSLRQWWPISLSRHNFAATTPFALSAPLGS